MLFYQGIYVRTTNFSSRRREAYTTEATRVNRYIDCLLDCGLVSVRNLAMDKGQIRGKCPFMCIASIIIIVYDIALTFVDTVMF